MALRREPKAVWNARRGVWTLGKYWYDETAADRAAQFFPKHLRLTDAEWAGKPFVLQGWQEHDIVRPLFGWKRPDGTRRYRRAYVWVPRKNGKTELAAGLSLLMLLGDAEPGGQVFSIAAEKEQASIVFNKAATMVASAPSLSTLIESFKHSIYVPRLNASFRPLSGKPKGKHGLSMSGLVGDEIHEWPTGDLYTFVHDSASARRQPLEFLISTAGVSGSYGEEVYRECQAMLAGDIDDPETLVVIYAAPADADWTSPDVWRAANPNFGVSLKADTMAAECRRAQQIPRLEGDFKRYRLNIWTDQATPWLPIDAVDDDGKRFGWMHCSGDIAWNAPEFEARLQGKRCFGGLDLSSIADITALVWWFPVQPGLEKPVMLSRFWKPEDLIKDHARRDRQPYEQLVKSGALFATPGNVVDYAFIREQIRRDGEAFAIAYRGQSHREAHEGGLALDRWNATDTTTILQAEGLPVVKFGQGFASMSAPSKELERLVISNAFEHGGHPLLERHARAVAVKTDPADNIKPVKPTKHRRVDGIVAGVMALGIAMAAGRNVITDEMFDNMMID